LSVGAVPTAHDNHGIHFLRQGFDLALPSLRGVADRIEDDGVGKARLDRRDDAAVFIHALGGLGDDAHLVQGRQPVDIFHGAQQKSLPEGISQQSVHLGMAGIANDEDGVIPDGMLFDNGLDTPDLGTGGIDNLEVFFPEQLSILGGNAVGANDDAGRFRAGGDFLDGGNGNDPPFSQQFHGLGVVDQGPVGIDGLLALVLGQLQDHVHGPLDPHAEARRFREFDAHDLFAA